MSVPFRIGVMQLTMEPLDEMLASARVMDEAGMDTIWLAEAYPWWRKHGMEARSSTVVSALMARETTRLTIGWGSSRRSRGIPCRSRWMRASCRRPRPGPFILGFGTSKIFLNNAEMQTSKTLGPMRDAVEIVRGVLGGEAFEYTGSTWNANVPAHAGGGARAARRAARLRRGDGAEDAAARGRDRRRCLTPSITTPAFVRYTRGNVAADIDIGCTIVASIHATDRDRRPRRRTRDRRHVSREQGAEHPGLRRHAARSRGNRAGRDPPCRRGDGAGRPVAAKAQVTDALLDKCKPIAGTPSDCIAAIEEYKDAGCTHVMLELWGADRHEQIRLFGEQVLPHVRGDRPDAGRRAHANHPLLACRGGRGPRHPAVRRAHGRSSAAPTGSSRAASTCRAPCSNGRADPTSASTTPSSLRKQTARHRLRRGLLVEPRRGDAGRAWHRRR